MVGIALGTKGRNPINLSEYKRNRGNHEQGRRRGEWQEVDRERKHIREKKLNKKRIRKPSGKVERVMAEIGACVHKSTFLSP